MIPLSDLPNLPVHTLEAVARALARDIDAGLPDRRPTLERVIWALKQMERI